MIEIENKKTKDKTKDEESSGIRALIIGIALFVLGFLWFPFATIPGPGFGAPWFPSPWWLLWPAVCVIYGFKTLIDIKKNPD
jgi:hypothetical protein